MATCANTIKLALRKLRVIGHGESPDSTQQADALTELNAYIEELLGNGGSLDWKPIYTTASMTVSWDYPAQRIHCKHGSAITITLPKGTTSAPLADGFRLEVHDVANVASTYNITIARNGWLINGSAANYTISTSGQSKRFMFRADLGDWTLASTLVAGDNLPFPTEFDLPIALLLAHRLGGEYGQQLAQQDLYAAIAGKAKLRARYAKPPGVIYPDGAAGNMGGITTTHGVTGQDQSVA